MKALVHIGSPKAGSSSIQDFLHLNTDHLAAQGFRFHRNVRDRGSQFEYPMAAMARAGVLLRNETERARYEARTLDEARAGSEKFAAELKTFANRWPEPVAIFSSEHILPWLSTPTLVSTMDEMFTSAFSEVRYIVYFRSPSDTIVSQYSERIKRGYSFTLDEFIERRLKGLDIFRPARRWANTVGRNRLDVRLFDRGTLKDGDLVADFAEACGFDPAGMETPPIVNEGLSAPAAECLRVLNSMVPEIRPDGSANPLRANILDTVAELSREMPRLVLNSRQKQRVDAYMSESNEKFRRWFFHGRRPLFPERTDLPQALSQAELSDLALEIMAKLLIQSRMGQLAPLNLLDRHRALITERTDADDMSANDTATPKQIAGTRTH